MAQDAKCLTPVQTASGHLVLMASALARVCLVAFGIATSGATGRDRVHNAARIMEDIRADARRAKDEFEGRRLAEGFQAPSRGLSPKPLLDQIVQKYGRPLKAHSQKYARGRKDRRLGGATLSQSNTRPIRIHYNFDTLYEDNVQANPLLRDRYCFNEGDWYRVNFPSDPKPTGAGPDNCNRDTVDMEIISQDKWCKCTANDVISTTWRDFVIDAVHKYGAEIAKYLSVKPVQGSLVFQKSEGSFPSMWASTNQLGSYCNADCVKGSHVVVPETQMSHSIFCQQLDQYFWALYCKCTSLQAATAIS